MRTFPTIAMLITLTLVPLAAAGAGDSSEVDDATKATVKETIEAYIEADLELKEQFFILDPRTGEPLALEFDYVHAGVYPYEESLRSCVDFKDADGTVYDVDVTVAIDDQGIGTVDKVWVHKVAGEKVE